jgi:hypothetical protein
MMKPPTGAKKSPTVAKKPPTVAKKPPTVTKQRKFYGRGSSSPRSPRSPRSPPNDTHENVINNILNKFRKYTNRIIGKQAILTKISDDIYTLNDSTRSPNYTDTNFVNDTKYLISLINLIIPKEEGIKIDDSEINTEAFIEIYNEIESKIIIILEIYSETAKQDDNEAQRVQSNKFYSIYYKISRRSIIIEGFIISNDDIRKIKIIVFKLIGLFVSLTNKLMRVNENLLKYRDQGYILFGNKKTVNVSIIKSEVFKELTRSLIKKINEYYEFTRYENYLNITNERINDALVNRGVSIEIYNVIEDHIIEVLNHYKKINENYHSPQYKRYLDISKRNVIII